MFFPANQRRGCPFLHAPFPKGGRAQIPARLAAARRSDTGPRQPRPRPNSRRARTLSPCSNFLISELPIIIALSGTINSVAKSTPENALRERKKLEESANKSVVEVRLMYPLEHPKTSLTRMKCAGYRKKHGYPPFFRPNHSSQSHLSLPGQEKLSATFTLHTSHSHSPLTLTAVPCSLFPVPYSLFPALPAKLAAWRPQQP